VKAPARRERAPRPGVYHPIVARSLALVWMCLALSLAACDRGPCEETCRHVAQCRRAKAEGERMLGEGKAAADSQCLARCEAATPEFAACEGKKRECDAVLACIPYR
jgi:Cys-rich protein (TIGR04453 family)